MGCAEVVGHGGCDGRSIQDHEWLAPTESPTERAGLALSLSAESRGHSTRMPLVAYRLRNPRDAAEN
jgi:hypothetical protein